VGFGLSFTLDKFKLTLDFTAWLSSELAVWLGFGFTLEEFDGALGAWLAPELTMCFWDGSTVGGGRNNDGTNDSGELHIA
jgi:hypothetical protein